jgi:hypothetical protein
VAFVREELGLVVASPTVVSSNGKWYALLASGHIMDTVIGPNVRYETTNSPYDGYSNRKARIFILNAETGADALGTKVLEVPEANSFFSDPFVPIAKQPKKPGDPWSNHVIYYGLTVSRAPGTCVDSGALYRLKMVNDRGEPIPPKY